MSSLNITVAGTPSAARAVVDAALNIEHLGALRADIPVR